MNDGLEINPNGSKFWRKNGVFHREDGPAIEWADGGKQWYINGKLHREDGPAVERTFGYRIKGRANDWYWNGKFIFCNSQQEFEKLLSLRAFW